MDSSFQADTVIGIDCVFFGAEEWSLAHQDFDDPYLKGWLTPMPKLEP